MFGLTNPTPPPPPPPPPFAPPPPHSSLSLMNTTRLIQHFFVMNGRLGIGVPSIDV